MEKIAYKIDAAGRASDIRYVDEKYVAGLNETVITGDSLPDPKYLHALQVIIDMKKAEGKAEAAKRIDAVLPDWQARRHKDQIELAAATTFTAADYTAKKQKCQAIRDASNTIEAEIQALTDPAAVENFDIANHPAWPV